MAHILFDNRVLARARNEASVAAMSTWGVAELFAALSTPLHGMLAEVARSGVWNNRFTDAVKYADGSPHFVYRAFGKETALYVVCISSPKSEAALSAAQYAWAEQHPEADVWLLPCVVQHLRPDFARMVADRFVVLRTNGQWSQDADARQFLPVHARLPHWLGSAGVLKMRNIVRELANNGLQIYPYISGVAHSKHLPKAIQLRCYGDGTTPTVVAVLHAPEGEPPTVLWADFYSDINPVHELEVQAVAADALEVLDAYGRNYRACCAELQMFPGRILPGMHLRCAMNLPATSFAYLESPEYGCEQTDDCNLTLKAQIRAVQRVQCCGMEGYCLQAAYDAALPNQCLNVFVFEHLFTGKLPQVGTFIEATGKLMLTPDSLVETTASWVNATKPLLPPAMAPMEALAQAFAAAGYQTERAYEPVYRFGRPDLYLLTPQGEKLFVFVDFVVNGVEDHWGYRRRFYPNRYPAYMNRNAQGEGPAHLCFVTLHLTTCADADEFDVQATFYGTQVNVTLPPRLRYPVQDVVLTDSAYVVLLETVMTSRDFSVLIPCLREDLHYSSETADITLHSKTDFLRHMRGRFDQWAKVQPPPELSFFTASVKYQGESRLALLAYQDGEPVSATMFEPEHGYISRMVSLAPQSVNMQNQQNEPHNRR